MNICRAAFLLGRTEEEVKELAEKGLLRDRSKGTCYDFEEKEVRMVERKLREGELSEIKLQLTQLLCLSQEILQNVETLKDQRSR